MKKRIRKVSTIKSRMTYKFKKININDDERELKQQEYTFINVQ